MVKADSVFLVFNSNLYFIQIIQNVKLCQSNARIAIYLKTIWHLYNWIDSKPIVRDSSAVLTDNSDWLDISLTRFLLNKRTQVF